MVDQGDLFKGQEDLRAKAVAALREYMRKEAPTHSPAHDTELLAAATLANGLLALRVRVLALLLLNWENGLAGWEVCKALGGKESTNRTRLGELVRCGLAYDSRYRRPNPDGNLEIVRLPTRAALSVLGL